MSNPSRMSSPVKKFVIEKRIFILVKKMFSLKLSIPEKRAALSVKEYTISLRPNQFQIALRINAPHPCGIKWSIYARR